MAESLKLSPSLSRSECTSPSGLEDSAEGHSQPARGTMSRRAASSSDPSVRDDSPSAQSFVHADCHSVNVQHFFHDPAGCDDHPLVDLCSAFSTFAPNNRLEPHALLLRVPPSSDTSSINQLPLSSVPSVSLSANCLPFSSVVTPQTRSDVLQSADTRHSDCCDGRSIPRIFTATQDAENGLPSIPQGTFNTQEPRVWDATTPNSSNNTDVTIDFEAGISQSSNLAFPGFISTRPFPRVTPDPSFNAHPRIGNTTQRSSVPSLNVRVTVCPPVPYTHSRSPSIRSRRISSDSIQLSPLDVTIRYHISPDEADSLPALLSPSGSLASERDRPPTPATLSEAGSQVTSNEDRSRFIRPGTPIQTQLPEIGLMDSSNFDGSETNSNNSSVWLVSEEGVPQSQYEFQISQEEEDLVGDMGRAKELLDGLEKVGYDLVRRYEKIRGDGHDICAICRELLTAEAHQGEHSSDLDPGVLWNLRASEALPFYSLEVECNIHAFPCVHLFHTDCLFPWLCIKTTCPTCRLDIDPHSLTLRVRGWTASRFPQFDGGEPRYVNVDVLGRRIPWHRPPAPNLEDWVVHRERDSSLQNRDAYTLNTDAPAGSSPKPFVQDSIQREQQEIVIVEGVCSIPREDTSTDGFPTEGSDRSHIQGGERHLGAGTDIMPRGSMNVGTRIPESTVTTGLSGGTLLPRFEERLPSRRNT